MVAPADQGLAQRLAALLQAPPLSTEDAAGLRGLLWAYHGAALQWVLEVCRAGDACFTARTVAFLPEGDSPLRLGNLGLLLF